MCFRERVLLEDAKRQPLFKPRSLQREGDRSYPNVYDSMATIKLTPSFLAGKPVSTCTCISDRIVHCCLLQVGLPAGSDKKDHEFYEEVVVSHSAVPPPFITEKILIKELDDVPRVSNNNNNNNNSHFILLI